MESNTDRDEYKKELLEDLIRRYGFVMTGAPLYQVLGFKSVEGFRQAKLRGLLPVNTFKFPDRRGHFALAADVAECLCAQRFNTAHQRSNQAMS